MSSLADGDRLAARSSRAFAAIRLPMMVRAESQEIVDPVRGNRAAFHKVNPHQAQCTGQGVLLVVDRAELGLAPHTISRRNEQLVPKPATDLAERFAITTAQSLKERLDILRGGIGCMVAPPTE